jgi:isoleucyl-tRNA synthetase
MSDKPATNDYSKTLYLPQTEFPMRAGLPTSEPKMLARWNEISTASCAKARRASRNSCCMTARPMRTATSISAMR